MPKLVKFESNWADEFDLQGYALFTDEQFVTWEEKLSTVSWGREFWFGTNESIEYSKEEHYRKDIDIVEITQEDYDTLVRLLGVSFGNFINPTEYE